MANSASVTAWLSAKDKGFVSTLKEALGATDNLQKKLKGGFSFGIFSGAGQKAFSMLQSGVSGFVSELNSSNAAWKTFESNMSILGKTGSDVEAAKKELQSFAEDTIYSSSDMAQTFAQLEAVGTKDTAKLVKGFGGLAAAAENPAQAMKTLSTQATQMAARPTVAWADFKLMLEQSPAGMAAVARGMGMTTSELVSKIQDGDVATKDFLNTIAEVGTSPDFDKMARQAKTMGQSMDSVKETLANKLSPAFEVLSQIGINAMDGIGKAIGKIDAQGLANKISSAVEVVKEFISVAKGAFAGVGKAFGNAFKTISAALGKANSGFSKTAALDRFKSICTTVANALKSVAGFLEKNADTIAKVLPWVAKLGGAFAAYKVVKSLAPGLTSFAGALLKMAGKGIAGLAAKLLGIAAAEKATGTASATSAPSMMQAALAVLALGAGVGLAAAGLALLVLSAVQLAAAGWPAALALGALLGVITLLAIGAAAIGPALALGAPGLLAFGAAIALVGLGAVLAGAGLAIVAAVLPQIVAYGLQGAIALGVLSVGMIAFAAGAALAGVGCIVLGAGLLIIAAALLVAGAAMLLFGTGALLAAASLAIISLVLPTIAAYGLQGALAFVALGGALLVFAAGAAVAGIGALALSVGLIAATVGIALAAVAVALLAVAMTALAASTIIAAAGFGIIAVAIMTILTSGMLAMAVLLKMCLPLLAFTPAALIAGAAALVLAGGFAALGVATLVLAAGMILLGAGIIAVGAGSILAAVGLTLLTGALALITTNCMQNCVQLMALSAAFIVFGLGAAVAGAAALILGAGLLVTAAAVLLLAAGVVVLSAGVLMLAAGFAIIAASLATTAAMFPLMATGALLAAGAFMSLLGTMLILTPAMLMLSMALIALTAGVAVGALSVAAFAIAMIAASAGTLVMAGALLLVTAEMKSIAKSAKSAEKSLKAMRKSVDVVESGLKAIKGIAKGAMEKLLSAFDNTAPKLQASGMKIAMSFVLGTKVALMAGVPAAFAAGANIAQGFANGMLSMLGKIQAVAAQMAAAADKAVRAKAKIHSPSKVSEKLGLYWGEGFTGGISDMAKEAWRAAANLVSMPTINTPRMGLAYAGEMSEDYSYYRDAAYIIEVPVVIDGKEVARVSAPYTEAELNKRNARESRKRGRL